MSTVAHPDTPFVRRRFEALDSFRGICAVLVVFFHLRGIDSISDWSFIRNSDLFVEFFFVLSGFVLAHGYAYKETLGFRRYFISRTFRLFPLHLFMVSVFLLMEFGKWIAVELNVLQFADTPFTGAMSLGELIPNITLTHAWTPYTNHLSFNHPSWSISIEYYMYMIFFALLLVKSAGLRNLLWAGVSIVAFYLLLVDMPNTLHPASGLSCFFAGALSYSLFRKIHQHFNYSKQLSTLIELAVLGLVFFIITYQKSFQQEIASVSFCLAVFVFAFEQGAISQILKHKVFQYVGKLSYSIYLTHVMVITLVLLALRFLSKFLGEGYELAPLIHGLRYFNLGSSWANNSAMVLVVLLVIFLSNFTYKYIELPGQKLGKRI